MSSLHCLLLEVAVPHFLCGYFSPCHAYARLRGLKFLDRSWSYICAGDAAIRSRFHFAGRMHGTDGRVICATASTAPRTEQRSMSSSVAPSCICRFVWLSVHWLLWWIGQVCVCVSNKLPWCMLTRKSSGRPRQNLRSRGRIQSIILMVYSHSITFCLTTLAWLTGGGLEGGGWMKMSQSNSSEEEINQRTPGNAMVLRQRGVIQITRPSRLL